MDNKILTEKLYKWKTIGCRTVGRSKMRWEEDVIKCLKKMQVTNVNVAVERRAWKTIIEKTKNTHV